MSESRDANDPRDLLRAMRKQERSEFEREEAGDTGGREHVTPDEGEARGERGAMRHQSAEIERATGEQSGADALRTPHGGPVTGGGQQAAGGPSPKSGAEPEDE